MPMIGSAMFIHPATSKNHTHLSLPRGRRSNQMQVPPADFIINRCTLNSTRSQSCSQRHGGGEAESRIFMKTLHANVAEMLRDFGTEVVGGDGHEVGRGEPVDDFGP